MKLFLTIMMTLSTLSIQAQNGEASTTKKAFSRETTVNIKIDASPEIIWALLTNGSDFSRWNSTIVSLNGTIAEGEKIQLVSTVDTSRTFKLKVKKVEEQQEMIWADGAAPFFSGKRKYTLQQNSDGTVHFQMTEKLGGLMFPMAAKSIPSFDESFEVFAADLKKEAEKIQNK